MTTAPHWLDDACPPTALLEKPRMLDKYAVEALGTFGLVVTVGVGVCSGTSFAALGIGVVLMTLIYAAGYRTGAHFNPAITLAGAVWGRIPFREAVAHWLVQLAAGLSAAITTRLIIGSGQSEAVTQMMLSGRALVAAFGAELLFTFVLDMWCSAARNRPEVRRIRCGTWLSVLHWWRAPSTFPRYSAACFW